MSIDTNQSYITRRDIPGLLASKGYRIKASYLDVLCSPAVNKGPPPAGRFGNYDIYTPDAVLTWASQRAEVALKAARERHSAGSRL